MICVFGLLAYGLSLNADFYMDDYPFVLEQETVTGGEWDPHGRGFRQLPFLLWRGIYAVAGESASAFHALNMLTHVGAACALFLAGGLLFRKLGLSAIGARRAALVGALVFVVHPFASDAVNYTRCLEIELVTLFSLLSLWAMLRLAEQPNARHILALAAFFAAAVFSKGPGVFHAGVVLGLTALALFKKEELVSGIRALWEKSRGAVAASIALAGVAGVWLVAKFSKIIAQKLEVQGLAYHWEHALTQGRMFWAYLAKMVAPFGMTSDHLLPWSKSAADVPAMLGLIGAALLCVAVVAGLRRKRFRIVALLAGLVIAPLALRFLYPNNELFVEYRAYPALPFFGLLVGFGLSALYDRAHSAGKWAGLGLMLALTVLSAMRTVTWANAEWLAEDSLEKYPLNNRARTQLQGFAYKSGEYERVFEIAAEIDKNFAAITAANNELPFGRRYEEGRALRNVVNSKQLITLSAAELAGPEKALAYAEKELANLAKHTGLDPESEEFQKVAGSLLAARELTQKGLEDRDRNLAGGTPAEPE
jgi:hypothetical protein